MGRTWDNGVAATPGSRAAQRYELEKLKQQARAAAAIKAWRIFYEICDQHDRLALQYRLWE